VNFRIVPPETGVDTSVLPAETPPWASYIAIGDSVTEGLDDPYPGQATDSDIRYRGWADRLAEVMTARRIARGLAALEYANLAIRGKLLPAIIEEQLPSAIAQKPDLISLIGGGNDVLRPNADIFAITDKLEAAVIEIRTAGIEVLLGTGFKAGGKLAWTRGRTGQLNSFVWSIARRHGAYVMDTWGVKSLYDYQMFAEDIIHPNSIGHSRMTNAALVGLGLAPITADWDVMLPPPEPQPLDPTSRVPTAWQPRVQSLKEDARWAKEFAGPWIERRLRGRSSGDGRTAKYPTLTPWLPNSE